MTNPMIEKLEALKVDIIKRDDFDSQWIADALDAILSALREEGKPLCKKCGGTMNPAYCDKCDATLTPEQERALAELFRQKDEALREEGRREVFGGLVFQRVAMSSPPASAGTEGLGLREIAQLAVDSYFSDLPYAIRVNTSVTERLEALRAALKEGEKK